MCCVLHIHTYPMIYFTILRWYLPRQQAWFCFNLCCPFLVLCYGFLYFNTQTKRMSIELNPTSNFHCLSLYGTIVQCQIKLVFHVSAKYLLFLRPDTVLSFHYIGVFMHTPHANTLRLMCMDSNTSIRNYMSLLSN